MQIFFFVYPFSCPFHIIRCLPFPFLVPSAVLASSSIRCIAVVYVLRSKKLSKKVPHLFCPFPFVLPVSRKRVLLHPLSGTEAAMFERFSPFSGLGPEKTSLEIWKCGGKLLIFAAGFPRSGERVEEEIFDRLTHNDTSSTRAGAPARGIRVKTNRQGEIDTGILRQRQDARLPFLGGGRRYSYNEEFDPGSG